MVVFQSRPLFWLGRNARITGRNWEKLGGGGCRWVGGMFIIKAFPN